MASMVDKLRSGTVTTPSNLSRKLKVIGSGFGRTGTMSMSVALEHLLGGPVYHTGQFSFKMKNVCFHNASLDWTLDANHSAILATIKTWRQMLRLGAKPEFIQSSLKSLLAGYVAVTDTWGAALTPELLEAYPDAVVICTVREPNAWWQSWNDMVGMAAQPLMMKIMLCPLPVFRYFPWALDDLWRRFCGHYGISPPSPPTGKEFAQYHIDWLKRVVPPQRLHFFNVKEGWEPLCRILGVPVPDEPFPRVNERAAMRELAVMLTRMVVLRCGLVIIGTIASVLAMILARRLF